MSQKGGSNIFAPPFQKKIERVRLMLPLELLCISPELTRVTCLVTSTLKSSRIKKDFRIQIVRQILTHFFKKKRRIVNFHMIDLFTSALSGCQIAFSILCEVFNSVEEVTLSIIRELKSQFL